MNVEGYGVIKREANTCICILFCEVASEKQVSQKGSFAKVSLAKLLEGNSR